MEKRGGMGEVERVEEGRRDNTIHHKLGPLTKNINITKVALIYVVIINNFFVLPE